MTLRHRGADLPVVPEALADALPDADARVAIFVHGLGETDASWRLRADAQRARLRRVPAARPRPHPDRAALQHRPAHLRQRPRPGRAAGASCTMPGPWRSRRSSSSGTRWAGSSRAAPATTAAVEDHAWTSARAPRLLPGLAAPRRAAGEGRQRARLGAGPRARDATAGQPARRAQRRDQGPALRRRASRRTGATATPTSCSRDRCHDVPFLPGARFYFVAATLSRRPGDPLGAILGDLLVRVPSAVGRGAQAQGRLRDRGRPPRRRPDALRPAQPPRGVRPDPGLDRAMSDRELLLARLRDAGADDEEIERADAEERLPTLAVELALGGAGRHSLSHVAREVGPAARLPARAHAGRRAPQPRARRAHLHRRGHRDRARDQAPRRRRACRGASCSRSARVLGQGMAHTSEAVRRLVGNALMQPGDSEYTVGLRFAAAADELAPLDADAARPPVPRAPARRHAPRARDRVRARGRPPGRHARRRDRLRRPRRLHAPGRAAPGRGPREHRRALRRPGRRPRSSGPRR